MGLMSLVERSALRADSASPFDDRYYGGSSFGQGSDAGVTVNPTTSVKNSAVFACVNLIARTIASLPLITYRRMPADDRERATDHWAYPLLRRRPNRWQTSFDWLYLKTVHVLLRGNNVDRLYFNRMGEVTDLWPLMPELITASRLRESGELRYAVRRDAGPEIVLLSDEVTHIRDYAPDGVWGLSRIQLGAQSIGLALAAESYGSRFFANNATMGIALEHPKTLSKTAVTNIEDSVMRRTTGVNQFRPFVAEEGMVVKQLSINGRDAQLIESRGFQVADIARWFGVPLYMIGMEEKSTSWGTGIEEQKNGYVTFTIAPFLEHFTQIINAALFGDDDEMFCEFNTGALLKGNTLDRFATYERGIRNRIFNPNEVRKMENMNRGPVELDQFYDPQSNAATAQRQFGGDAQAAFALLSGDAADRIAGAEARELERRAKRADADPSRYAAWADGFYSEHLGYVERVIENTIGAWTRLTGTVVPVGTTALEVARRGRQAADPCPTGDELGEWKARRAQQVAGIIDAALTPQTMREAA